MNYYFLAASLPPLALEDKPELSFVELSSRLKLNLTKEDFEKTVVLRRYIDLLNIRSLLLEEPVDRRGNLSEKELDEALLVRQGLPDYVFEFLDAYPTAGEKVKHFSGLLAHFFAEEIPKQRGFLCTYLSFERDWRLVMTALRSKLLKRDLVHEMQFEDLSDALVMQILAQKDADSYEPPIEYKDLKELFSSCQSDAWKWNRAFAAWRFHRIEELVEKPLFSIDWILAYMAQLITVEDWHGLDRDKGRMILDTFKAG